MPHSPRSFPPCELPSRPLALSHVPQNCTLNGRGWSKISRYQVRAIDAHVGANGHEPENRVGVKQSLYWKLPVFYVQHVRWQISFAFDVGCMLFKHGVVYKSSYFEFPSSDSDPAYLITCIHHVSFCAIVYTIHLYENWVLAIDLHITSTFINFRPLVVIKALTALESNFRSFSR